MATQQSTEPVWHSGRRQRGGQSLLCKRWETLNYTFSCYTTSEGTCTRCPAISLTGTWWVFVVRIQSISLTPAPVLAEMAAFLPVAAHPWSRNASEHWEGSLCISVPLTSKKLKDRRCRAQSQSGGWWKSLSSVMVLTSSTERQQISARIVYCMRPLLTHTV